MNMAQISHRLFAILVLLLCISGSCAQTKEVVLTYMENGTQLFTHSQTVTGCYAELDSYPHWCLGNLSRCNEGISVSFWLRPNRDVALKHSPDIVLTSGGWNVNSDGFFITRSYFDQFTVGVALKEKLWQTTFRLSTGSWILLSLMWETSDGLTVLIDGLPQEPITEPQTRNFNPDFAGRQASILVGITKMGEPVPSPCSFDVNEIKISHSRNLTEDVRTTRNVTLNLFKGCTSTNAIVDYNFEKMSHEDSGTFCRSLCHNKKKSFALVRNATSCVCVSDVSLADLSKTQCDGRWFVYDVTHIQTAHNYQLHLDYTPLSKNPYTKPEEDILFNVAIDNPLEVVYTFVFDDGVVVSTTRSSISHSWMTPGSHNVTVSTRIGIISLEGMLLVAVEDVDEGEAPNFVGVIVFHDRNALTAQVSIMTADEHSVSCYLSFGDGQISTPYTFMNFGDSVQVLHKHRICGYFKIQVKCSNKYGNATADTSFRAKEIVTGYHYISNLDSFGVQATGDHIFFRSLIVKVDDLIVDFDMDYGSVKIRMDDLKGSVDNVISLISDGVLLDRHLVSVRVTLQKPTIAADRTKGAWNVTVRFTFTLLPSDHTWMVVDFGNGLAKKVVYVPETSKQLSLSDVTTYQKLGVYTVTVQINNEISEANNTLEISVEVPIQSLMITTNNITSLKDQATFMLEINKKSQGPQKVDFHFDYGDGNLQDISYTNNLTNAFQPLLVKHVYMNWGIYKVKVTAVNNISQVVDYVVVQVGENITFLDIHTRIERVNVYGWLDFIVECPTGSDVRYFLDFGDGTNFTVGELTGPEYSYHSNASLIIAERIIVSHMFASHGFYNVKVTAGNTFGSWSANLCPIIDVVDFVSTSCPEPVASFRNMTTSLSNPLVRKRSVSTLITVDAISSCPNINTELTYSWKGASLVNRGGGNFIEQSIYTVCIFKSLENFLTIEALSLPFGLFRFTVTVSTVGNDISYTRKDLYIKVIQSEPLPVIDGDDVITIMLYATAIFDVSKSYDPDLAENQRQGISFHLVFLPEVSLKESKKLPLGELMLKSSHITNKTLFPTTTANPFSMYQYGTCFNDTADLLDDISTFAGKITFAANNFVTDYFSFGVILWAERNNLTAMTSQIIEVRATNMSLEDLGSLLDLAMNADPDTAIRLCGGAASAILNQDTSSAEVQEKLAESTEAVVKTLGAVAGRIDSPNQAAKCASAIKTMTRNKDIVSEGSRSTAVDAFVSLANGTSAMVEATVDDTASFAGECLGGLSNIFPTGSESKKASQRATSDQMSTTTELLGLLTTRMTDASNTNGYTASFSTRSSGTKTTYTTTRSSITTSRTTQSTATTPTTSTKSTPPAPTATTTTVITTATSTIYHVNVGTTLSPAVRSSFVDNGNTFTISGITVATLQFNASKDSSTLEPYTTTVTTTPTITATVPPEDTPVTISINPRMLEPRYDHRTAHEIAQEILNWLPAKDTYNELMDYIFNDCLLFRKAMKAPEIQNNCPAISSEAINLMKCDEDFSLQDRVFDILTYREHPDDLYEVYLLPLNKAKNERDQARKDTDKMVVTSGQAALQTVADSVGSKTDGEDKSERSFVTSRLTMKLGKVGINNATNATEPNASTQAMQMEIGAFEMPSGVLNSAAGKCPNVNTLFMGDSDNPFTYSESSSSVGKSVLSLSYSCNGNKVAVEGSQEPILLWIERDASVYQHGLFILMTNTKRDVWTNFNYHPVNISDKNGSLQVVIEPQDSWTTYSVYIKYGDRPNNTHYDFLSSTPNSDATQAAGYGGLNFTQKAQLRYTVTVPLELTYENGTYWIGIKVKSGNVEMETDRTNTSYTLLILVSGCRFWDESINAWSSEGCKVGPLTTKYRTQCYCNHLTSFGSDSIVAPNTIDFVNVWTKFNQLGENAAVFSTVVSLIGVYVILLVWLRHMDKRDLVKWGALPLEDNIPTDSYFYQVTVQTGIKKGAGTDSKVRFIVSGEDGDSGVRRLVVSDNQRKHLPRGSILNYVMSVDACLGPLTFLRIWHDNSGNGKNKSWYLDHVQLSDIQTGEKFIFLCDRWLAVEEDDGMVDRILAVAGVDDLIAFKQLFTSSARTKLTNDHLWISVFSRPTRSNFTRVQRLSCCMSLLFLTMITNAMWFKNDTTDQKQVDAINLGPFSFTLAQVFISFASTFIVFPPNFLMITFFRRCRPKNNVIAQLNQSQGKDKQKFRWKKVTSTSFVWGPRAKRSRLRKMKESVSKLITFNKRNKYADNIVGSQVCSDDVANTRQKKIKSWSLPFWCIYIAWTICFLSIVVSGFFTILYSMEWGREKANQWLTTFLLSFFESVIIVQPIKVLLLVAFIACVLKKPELDEDDQNDDINQVLGERERNASARDEASLSQIRLQRCNDNAEFQPPDPEELSRSRHNRLMELKMQAVLKEIVVYTFFLIVIFFLSYQQRDPQSYLLGNNIKNNMLSDHENIKTVLDYWTWLEDTFLPSLYALNYANETEIEYWQDAACVADMDNRRVGVARLRQMRVKNDTCTILPELISVINHCRSDYGWSNDDTKPYLPYWTKPPENYTDELQETDTPFVYQNSVKLKNAPYVGTLTTYKGGGYVILTKRLFCRTKAILDKARADNWLDLNTRAIFLEYTVYNPNSNLFASVTALTEFLTVGSATSRLDVKIFRLMSYIGGFGAVVLVFEILYGIITIYFFIQCVKKVNTERIGYFKDFWRLLEFILLCFAISCIALYSFKHVLTEVAMTALRNRKSDGFVNFNSIALYDEIYGYLMAVVVFMATIQFLKLLQFNKKMGMLGSTVKLAAADLGNFSITFLMYFIAFTANAFLLFGQTLATYQNVITAAESMFAFALGSFDYEELTTAQPFWGPVFIFSYIGVVYIGLMNIFLAIIGESFTQVKENVALQSNDYEVVDFIWKTIKGMFK